MRTYNIFLQALGGVLVIGSIALVAWNRSTDHLTYHFGEAAILLTFAMGGLGVFLFFAGNRRLSQTRGRANLRRAGATAQPRKVSAPPVAPAAARDIADPDAPMLCKFWHTPKILTGCIGEDFQADQKLARLTTFRNSRGLRLKASDFPARIVETGEGPLPTRPVEAAGLHLLFRNDLVELLKQADLGAAAFHPVKLQCADGTVKSLGYSFANFANVKDSFVEKASENLGSVPVTVPLDARKQDLYNRSRRVKFPTAAGDVALTRASLDGPDIWVELRIHAGIFISARLAALLKANGMLDAMCAVPCRFDG